MKIIWSILFIASVCLIFFFLKLPCGAHDLDGKYKDSPLRSWFNGLASKNGLCCSFADGRTIEDPDIDMAGDHYKVRIDGEWIDVPDSALITIPNKFGRAIVWPFKSGDQTMIRCFLPGAGI